jgi:hypothetical protein
MDKAENVVNGNAVSAGNAVNAGNDGRARLPKSPGASPG